MRKHLYRGMTLGCALALSICAAGWLASAAMASDSIYWSSYTPGGGLLFGDLGGSGAQSLFPGESSPEGVAIDAAAGKIYWADTTSGAIRVGNLDGTGARDLYTGETQPSGVAIDPASGLIYWADAVSRTGTIRVGNLDGSGTARTLFANESYPVGLTIDPADGKIYWGSYDLFTIRAGNLDGTGATTLFSGENYPTQLAVDPAAGRIYWTNEFNGNVRAGNLDGTGATSLYTGEGEIGGVAIDPAAGKIYWPNWQVGTVRVGSLDGTAPAQSLYTGLTNPWMVALLHVPLGSGLPQVSGSTGVGQTLTCSPGTWAPDLLSAFLYRAPRSFAYQWTLGGVPIAGATANSVIVSSPGDYRCAVTATNAAGSTTQTSAPTTVTAPATPPLLGRLVNAAPVSGKVFVVIKGKLVPVTGATQIRSGTEVDALHGTIALTSATGRGKETQTGTFGGAVFRVTQAKGGRNKGLTTLKLVEGAFKGAPTYATCKKHKKALDASAAATSSKTLQLLRASAKGKFRTSGRYSAATVRGTKWTVADRCDGTLTHDITHSVAVTDFVRHKTIVLHAGQSYLAKKPK
ncbi:MAG TPA: PQQ-binding-like beta-propeller repeat protein [Solirubrobacteraceae bacterium]|nr:PQQ-binding-like beta-propeller repeat protein [Solirubrobacteraceae bacterium]